MPICSWKLNVLGIIYSTILTVSCASEPPVDYSTQIKPIINKNCIACHGGVRKQAGLSFLFEEEALAQLESGSYAIVPGNPRKSEMIRRLSIDDPARRMPLDHDPLSDSDIELLTKWVKQGAKWGKHWAFESIEPVEIPEIEIDWGSNSIDQFIAIRFLSKGLEPSPRADPKTLSRRLSLDLIGMPSQDEITKHFINNPTSEEYEKLVDILLASPHFGEKWTSLWLDLARYADTKGYERDPYREIWRYRDWLIKAFNNDMPYDQFIIEQLAGDLLANPNDDQYIATAFHRNTMTNDEGGTDNEEFRTAAVIDRVNTSWEAIMGSTFACVQCHSHPYDPFTHQEYFEFMAFFNNTRDEDTYADYPVLRHFNPVQKYKLANVYQWAVENSTKQEADEIKKFIKTLSPARNSVTTDQFVNSELADTKWLGMRNHSSARLKNVPLTNRNKLLIKYKNYVKDGQLKIRLDHPAGKVIGHYNFEERKGGMWQHDIIELSPIKGTHELYFTYMNPRLTNPDQKGILLDWFYFTKDLPGADQEKFQDIEKDYWELVTSQVPGTPVMVENPAELKRTTHVFKRGNWLQKEKEVSPGTPGIFPPFPEHLPKNRLGLAHWMMSPKHPLTSRTIVNRIWESIFGTGIVETLEDMGTQGTVPSNQPLLDHLSLQLMNEDKWRLKTLIKKIVMSETYRQSSKINTKHKEIDPDNQYLSRMSRLRLSAEQIRDQALFVSGSLNSDLFGPPVMPYQPDGIWIAPYDGSKWSMSQGRDQYRRAIYTYWKRTSPYPSIITFDGVGREFCTSRRIRTNTPLQALVTMNDIVYMDLSRQLALKSWNKDTKTMLADAYKAATSNDIPPSKLKILQELYQNSIESYQANPDLAIDICNGVTKDNFVEMAAMIIVANSILNLDEVITKT